EPTAVTPRPGVAPATAGYPDATAAAAVVAAAVGMERVHGTPRSHDRAHAGVRLPPPGAAAGPGASVLDPAQDGPCPVAAGRAAREHAVAGPTWPAPVVRRHVERRDVLQLDARMAERRLGEPCPGDEPGAARLPRRDRAVPGGERARARRPHEPQRAAGLGHLGVERLDVGRHGHGRAGAARAARARPRLGALPRRALR